MTSLDLLFLALLALVFLLAGGATVLVLLVAGGVTAGTVARWWSRLRAFLDRPIL